MSSKGCGQVRLGAGYCRASTTSVRRWVTAKPEELLRGSHASRLSMALALELAKVGHSVQRLHIRVKVHFEEGESEGSIHRPRAEAPGPDLATAKYAQGRQENRPVS